MLEREGQISLAKAKKKKPQCPHPPFKQLNQMHIRINICGKRRPEKACYKEQAVLKIVVEQKTRRGGGEQISLISTVKKN
jgi:hypothetical protein